MLLSSSRNVKKHFKFACLICPFGPNFGQKTRTNGVYHCTQPCWLGCSLGVLAMMKYDFQRHGTITTHNGGASLTGDLLSFYPRSGPSSVALTIFFWVVCFIRNSIKSVQVIVRLHINDNIFCQKRKYRKNMQADRNLNKLQQILN